MSDLISRADAIEAVQDVDTRESVNVSEAVKAINALPSANRPSGEWIPVDGKLPKVIGHHVLVTIKWADDDLEVCEMCPTVADRYNIIAFQDLPEPYQGEQTKNITESPNEVDEKNDEVIDHDRKWIIGCIKHDGFIKTDRFDKANQIILEALEPTEPSDLIRQETIKELGDWLEQMIQHGVPSYSAKRKALANAIALLSMDTHEIHTETHECVKETHDSDLISRADTLAKIKEYCIDGDSVVQKWFDTMGIEEVINTMPSVSAEPQLDVYAQEYKAYRDTHPYGTDKVPSVSAERVGEWIPSKTSRNYICSSCGNEELVPTCMGEPTVWRYCPWCGARMEKNK